MRIFTNIKLVILLRNSTKRGIFINRCG